MGDARCRENVFDDFGVMPAFHPVFRQQAYNSDVPTHEVYPHDETGDGSPSNLCFTFMMLYNLTPIASPSALGTIAVRCKGGRLHQQVGTPHVMLTPDQQHELLRTTKSSFAIIDLSKDVIVVMGLNIATAERISLGVLESYHHVRSHQEATGRPGCVMNWRELCRFADHKSLEIIHFPEYGTEWPSRSLGGETSGSDIPLLPGRPAPEPNRPAFVLPPGVTAFFRAAACRPLRPRLGR